MAANLAASSPQARSGGQQANGEGQEETELLWMARQGNVSEVDRLLSQGVVSVNYAGFDGRTALHFAACGGHLDVVKLLLDKGADINAQDGHWSTPLDFANHFRKEDVCGLLIKRGAQSRSSTRILRKEDVPFSGIEVNPAGLQYSQPIFPSYDTPPIEKGIKVATWRGIYVAVKCFKGLDCNERNIMAFRSKLSVITKLRHLNVVGFLGAVTERTPVELVFEKCPKGSLSSLLKEKGALDLSKALDYSLDIARGLNYMHEHKPEAIFHGDLKPKNILQGSSRHLKLADIGLSKLLKYGGQTISKDGSLLLNGSSCRYMAPEIFKQSKYGKEADVFAFGLVVQEMIQGGPPMLGVINQKVPSAYADGNKRPPFKTSLGPQFETPMVHYPPDLLKLIKECWDKDPRKRPSFAQIINRLEAIQAKQPK